MYKIYRANCSSNIIQTVHVMTASVYLFKLVLLTDLFLNNAQGTSLLKICFIQQMGKKQQLEMIDFVLKRTVDCRSKSEFCE